MATAADLEEMLGGNVSYSGPIAADEKRRAEVTLAVFQERMRQQRQQQQTAAAAAATDVD